MATVKEIIPVEEHISTIYKRSLNSPRGLATLNDTRSSFNSIFLIKHYLNHFKRILISTLFVIISITIGVVIVIYNIYKPPNPICLFTFKTIITNSDSINSRPISIVFGDFNNDKILDVIASNSAINNIGIFIGDGIGGFMSPYFHSMETSSYPRSLAVSDFNKDNHLDVVVANFYSHTLDILLGNGHGNFTKHVSYFTGVAQPFYVTVSDINHDNHSDIIVINYGTNTLDIYLGTNNVNFERSISYSTGYDSIPYYVVIVDLNDDTWLDIIVANHGTNTIGIFFGYGNGNFSNQIIFSTYPELHPYSLVVADFNNDKYLDIIVAYFDTNNIGIFLGNKDGTFKNNDLIPVGVNGPIHMVMSDFNNDAELDIAVSLSNNNMIKIFLGFGNGSFRNSNSYMTGYESYPFSIIVEDFNRDNRSDLLVVNNGTNNIGVFLGYDPGAFQNQITYETDLNPRSIALADFNNDTYLDFVIANYKSHNVGVFLGLGDGNFTKQITYSSGTLSGPYSVAVNDMNNDNQLDIVTANFDSSTMGILFNRGNTIFANATTYSTGTNTGTSSVVIGNLNNDQWLDIAVTNYYGDNIGIFFGLGYEIFSNQISYSTGIFSGPIAINVGDFDNDKNVDIVVANSVVNTAGIFYGFGNGTFTQQIEYSTGFFARPYSIAVNDLNKDGLLDIVVANRHSDAVGILFGIGNRKFATVVTYKTGSYYTPYSVDIGDFNNDDCFDIVAANRDVSKISIFLGLGNGTFHDQIIYSLPDDSRPSCVITGDLNNDHRSDLIIANTNKNNAGIYLSYDNGALMDQRVYSTGSAARPMSVAVGDFDNDKRPDVAVANFGTNTIDIRTQSNTGNFENQRIYSTGSNSNPISIATGHFNKDNWLDIVVANYASSTIDIFLGFGNRTFSNQFTYSTGTNAFPLSVTVADLNHDNLSDIVVANSNVNYIGVFLADTYTLLKNPIMYSTGSITGPYFINAADFNHDNYTDIVAANYVTNNIGIFFGTENGTFTNLTNYSTGSIPRSIAIGDLNNDNHLDIVVSNSGSDSIGILFGYSNGSFAQQMVYSTGISSNPYFVVLNDLNNDERLDIVVANNGMGSFGIFFGLGNGTFTNQIVYSMDFSSKPYSIAIGDLNNDNYSDIVVANYGDVTIAIFLGLGNGTFTSPITYKTGTNYGPCFVTLNYFNNDKYLDIAIANYDDSNIGIFLGFGNGTFSNQAKYSTGAGTCPYAVLAGDFNNDYQIDLAAVTYYGNTIDIFLGFGNGIFGEKVSYWIRDGSLALSLILADFNNDKLLDVAVANSGTSDISIFLGYCCEPFRNQITYDTGDSSYPHSTILSDLNNDYNFDIIVANYGTNNIGILFGLTNGSFEEQKTYLITSDYFPHAIASADLNNDGWQDIIIAGHNTNLIIVFLGIGNGYFTSYTSYSIGISVHMSAVVIGDLNKDNKLDIIVSNDGTNNIAILYGYQNGTFSSVDVYSTGYGSLPSALATSDLNNDTQLDILIPHQGKNTVEIFSKFC
ncbi:unnamed protein product [Adineta ricciae]|uniref:FG-GAP repeat protein n=1 Tax=Adineta ricciae TaxID=249248 RepID=A0A815UUL0_ADIRI|nr:unnamed protein product [Adineta ricciae]CAF1608521.1 unnamed protein product [Adineta ricciae]